MKFIRALFCLALISNVPVFAGDVVGHGGDPLAAEFVARGYDILAKLNHSGSTILETRDLERFAAALKTTRIELVDDPISDPEGGSVTSVVLPDPNHPGFKYIRLHKSSWSNLLKGEVQINRYVFHEYLRVIDVEDSHYEVSSKLSQLAAGPFDRVAVITLEVPIKGKLIPASRPYPAQRLSGSSSTGGTPLDYITCKSTLKNSDEGVAKSLAEESFFDSIINWESDWKKVLIGSWSSNIALLSLTFTRTAEVAPVVVDYEERANSAVWIKQHDFQVPDTELDYLMIYWLYQSRPTVCPTEVGFQKFSSGQIVIRAEIASKLQSLKLPMITGQSKTFYLYPQAAAGDPISAIQSAAESFSESCNNWRSKMQAKLGARLVFADCGAEMQKRSPGSGFLARNVWFESSPTVYYTE